MLELVRGVNDTMLQQRLLQEETPTLKNLVKIAKLWQSAESAQTTLNTATTEFVRQANMEEGREQEEETEDVRKTSNIHYTLDFLPRPARNESNVPKLKST